MLKNVECSFVESLHALLKLCPTKSCATFFEPPDISVSGVKALTHYTQNYKDFSKKVSEKIVAQKVVERMEDNPF